MTGVQTCALPIYEPDGTLYKTLSFDERSKGWTSFFTYKPDAMFSSQGYFYSAKDYGDASNIYKHNTNLTRNSFYGQPIQPSSIQFVFNPSPNNVKTFQDRKRGVKGKSVETGRRRSRKKKNNI